MKRVLLVATCSIFAAGVALAASHSGDDKMGAMLTEADIAMCEETLAGWSDEKLMKTRDALGGSSSKSSAELAEATAAKYASAESDEALMALKCKSVLLMQMMDSEDSMMKSDDDSMMKSDDDTMMKSEDAMAPMLTEADIAACTETLAGWSDEKLMKTRSALGGSSSKSAEDLAAATAAKYASADSDEALMGLKCKSVLLMQMMNDG